MLNVSPVRLPLSSTLVLLNESWLMLKVLSVAISCPPELTVILPLAAGEGVSSAVRVPLTVIAC